jgi:hypothetical protein
MRCACTGPMLSLHTHPPNDLDSSADSGEIRMSTHPAILVTLANGTSYTLPLRGQKLPPAWKSWAMRQLPYGTSFLGARFAVQS